MLIVNFGFPAPINPEKHNPAYFDDKTRQVFDIGTRVFEGYSSSEKRRLQFLSMGLHGHPDKEGKYRLCKDIRPTFNSVIYDFNKRN